MEQFEEFGQQQLWKAKRGKRIVPSQQQFRFQKMTLFRTSTSGRGENNVTCSRWMVDLG
jgi:hypothetical protein